MTASPAEVTFSDLTLGLSDVHHLQIGASEGVVGIFFVDREDKILGQLLLDVPDARSVVELLTRAIEAAEPADDKLPDKAIEALIRRARH
jgi:hypothetical protein